MTQEPASTSPCPRCAVAVPIGYVKCPRCHAAMPSAPIRARRESMREQLIAGGTTVPESESGRFPWLFLAICAAAAITAIVWYVNSGGARAVEPGPVPIASAPTPPGVPVGSDVEPPASPTVDPRPHERTVAISDLDRALASDKLWAEVSEVGDTIVIRSGFCADKGIAARVDAVRARLGALGYRAVRCLEKSGGPVWARNVP